MIDSNEHVRSPEITMNTNSNVTTLEPSITHARAHQLFERRSEMLHSIKSDISVTLFEALRAKIAHEQWSLNALIETGVQNLEKKQRLDKVLPSEYFAQKAFPTHYL